MGSVWGIVVAAGRGSRYGSAKQFEVLLGRTVLEWALEAAREACDAVVAVLPAGATDGSGLDPAPDRAVPGGATRSQSVRAGLAAVPPDAAVIVVHDAARPLASPTLFARVVEAVRGGADGAVPGVPVADTLKRVDGMRVVATLDRAGLVAVQTPQAFSAAALRRAHEAGGEATDDAALVEASGGRVAVVDGERHNLKLTQREDLVLAAAVLGNRR